VDKLTRLSLVPLVLLATDKQEHPAAEKDTGFDRKIFF
jgi:hypothetical protein